jgi:DNA-binding MurR/RpiR family transcriptional regulator
MNLEDRSPEALPHGIQIGPWIRVKQEGLTSLENRIIEWLLTPNNISPDTPLKSVADQLGVSEAMIVKVAKTLGLNGFRQLRLIICEYFESSTLETLYTELSVHDEAKTIIDNVFQITQRTLNEGHAIIDYAELVAAATCFRQARQRELYGVGGSNIICLDIQHKLLKIGVRSNTYLDSHIMMFSACLLGPEDVVLVVTHSGRTEDLKKTVQLAKNNGAKVICITHSDNSPIAKLADYKIYSPALESPLLGRNASARILQLTLLDIFFVLVAKLDIQLSMDSIEKTGVVADYFSNNY